MPGDNQQPKAKEIGASNPPPQQQASPATGHSDHVAATLPTSTAQPLPAPAATNPQASTLARSSASESPSSASAASAEPAAPVPELSPPAPAPGDPGRHSLSKAARQLAQSNIDFAAVELKDMNLVERNQLLHLTYEDSLQLGVPPALVLAAEGAALMVLEQIKRETEKLKREAEEANRRAEELKRETEEIKRETEEMKRRTREVDRETLRAREEKVAEQLVATLPAGIAAGVDPGQVCAISPNTNNLLAHFGFVVAQMVLHDPDLESNHDMTWAAKNAEAFVSNLAWMEMFSFASDERRGLFSETSLFRHHVAGLQRLPNYIITTQLSCSFITDSHISIGHKVQDPMGQIADIVFYAPILGSDGITRMVTIAVLDIIESDPRDWQEIKNNLPLKSIQGDQRLTRHAINFLHDYIMDREDLEVGPATGFAVEGEGYSHHTEAADGQSTDSDGRPHPTVTAAAAAAAGPTLPAVEGLLESYVIFTLQLLYGRDGRLNQVNLNGVCPLHGNTIAKTTLFSTDPSRLDRTEAVDLFKRIFHLFWLCAHRQSVLGLDAALWEHSPVPDTTARVGVFYPSTSAPVRQGQFFKIARSSQHWWSFGGHRSGPACVVPSLSSNTEDDRIPGAQMVLESPTLSILTYPLASGSHTPRCARDFVPVVDKLIGLHQEQLCHSDVRLRNILFLSEGGSRLLDYDYCVEENSACYPSGWTIELPDVVRHPHAKPMALIRRVHDVYSLGSCLAMFQPVTAADRPTWRAAYEPLLKPLEAARDYVQTDCAKLLAGLREALEQLGDVELKEVEE
eukprot:m.126116 g.126116  ORF g.126116 m.126116 type:complete len:798 (+) comp14686_c1_seq1:50-2443(+)